MYVRLNWMPPHFDGEVVVGGMISALLLLFVAAPAGAQEASMVARHVTFEQVVDDWEDCGLRNIDQNAYVSHRLPSSKRQAASADIRVDYGDGFTPEARTAFERAVSIWETHIWSPITIRIDARFGPQEDRTLGGASSNLLYALDRDGDDQLDIVYGDALIDAYLGEDQNPSDPDDPAPPDIVATFNSSRNDWHFGAGDAPSGTVDFTTVVLHEIAHGLNYFDVFEYEDGEGRYGFDWDGNGTVNGNERFLGVFGNRIVQEQAGDSFEFLADQSVFPVPSISLGDALTSGRLFFDGSATTRAATGSDGPVPPKMYAPESFDEGSSISHLDEETYAPKTSNALMTPQINHAETVRRTGPIVCGQIADMGWTLGAGCAFEEASIEVLSADPQTTSSNRGQVELSWRLTGEVSVDSFIVEQAFFGTPSGRETVPASGPGEYTTTIDGLEIGDHTFRLIYVTSDGVSVQSGNPISATVSAQRPEVSVYPNPFFDVARVSFALPEAQDVRVEVFDLLGRHIATPFNGQRPADDVRPVVFDAGRLPDLPSGVYFFRVTGDTFTQTVRATHIR